MKNKTKQQVEKEHYEVKYDSLDRFRSYYFQIRSVAQKKPKTILEVGIGNKTVSNYLKKQGFNITTCDFDANLQPDKVGDIRDLPFEDEEFELVTAFEVLEHLPFEDFEKALKELGRVAQKTVIISIPYVTINFFGKIKLLPFLRPIYFLWRVLEYRWKKHEFDGQHYWEMGKKSCSRKKIRQVIKKVGFKIEKEFTPELNPYHYFFVLSKS